MESFLEEPRSIPKPTPLIQEMHAPSVPEVSLMFQNSKKNHTSLPVNHGKNIQSYNAWKLRNNCSNTVENDSFLVVNTEKENIARISSRKQVRFESPVLYNSITKDNNNLKTKYHDIKLKTKPSELMKTTVNPLEKLYMSNLPNRELDLSFLEPQKTPCNSARIQLPTQKQPTNNFATENYKNYSPRVIEDINSKVDLPKFDENSSKVPLQQTQIEETEVVTEKTKSDETNACDKSNQETKSNENITVNDLLSVIKLQNEQLQKLQTQVAKLIKLNEEKYTPSNENETHVNQEKNKNISVGLMTSFEVSFKPKKMYKKYNPPQPTYESPTNISIYECNEPILNKPHKKIEFSRKNKKVIYQNEETSYRTNNETVYSLGTQEDINIQELPESPENSIHIDMQEYDTDSSDDCSINEGWTFYEDILGQVNNLLENSPPTNYKQNREIVKKNYEKYTDKTLEQIKLSTMKRLQNQGFLQPNDNDQIKPTEVSFAVKQFFMKYLPDDGLTDVMKNHQQLTSDDKKPADISVAAFKYMQQCNVVTNAPKYYGNKGKTMQKQGIKNKNPKILDITTLKRQPKFL